MTKISNKNITDLISSIENLTSAMSRGKDDEELKKEREFNKELDKIMSKDLRGRREERKKAEEGMKKATSREEFEKYKKKYEATKTSFENEAKSMKATAVNDLASGLNTVVNTVFNILQNQVKRQEIKLTAATELQNRAIETYGKTLGKAASVMAGNITGKVLDTAFDSLNAVMEGGVSMYMKNLKDTITIRKNENELLKNTTDSISQGVEGVASVANMFGSVGQIVGSAISVLGNVGTKGAQLVAAQTEFEIKRTEAVIESTENLLNQAKGMVDPLVQMAKSLDVIFLEIGESAYKYSNSLGLTGEAQELYQKALLKGINVDLAAVNMNFKDYAAMLQSYNEQSGGRSSIIANREAMMIGALANRLNIGAGEVSSIVGGMNVFNTSIQDGSEMIFEMAHIANKMGLNATKFAKDLEKNLKLAEKYQFRGGVKGMMEMALWAQKTRFNIDSISTIQEKMLGGNIEDIIQTSARLNVLGGNAALYSDPLAMLYEGMDPMAMGKRINSIIQGYGTFDVSTGETVFNRVEMMRMNQIAQALGMSREDLMNQARQANKSEQIERMYGRKFNEKTLTGLIQHATWSQDKNDWIVKLNADNEAGFVEKGLNELNPEDKQLLQNIFPNEKQDQIVYYLKEIEQHLSPKQLQERGEKLTNARTLSETYSSMDELNRRLAEMRGEVNVEKASQIAIGVMEETVKSQESLNDFINNDEMSLKILDKYLDETSGLFNELVESLHQTDHALNIFANGGLKTVFNMISSEYGGSGGIDLKDFTNEMGGRKKLTKEQTRSFNILQGFSGNNNLISMIANATGKSELDIKEELAKGTHYYDYERGTYNTRRGTVITPVDVELFKKYKESLPRKSI
ncbi:MAG: hypothetical protein J6X18_06740, partial [Bacteroidales bacterium]|nr:hypothetical protein [Bacteroidales bacterium]